MESEKFYSVVLSDFETCIWITAYCGLFKEGPYGMLEQVRSFLLRDTAEDIICETVRENIRSYINAL